VLFRVVTVDNRFHMDPSGTFLQYDAKAIGSGSEGAQQSLQEVYHKVLHESTHYLLTRSGTYSTTTA